MSNLSKIYAALRNAASETGHDRRWNLQHGARLTVRVRGSLWESKKRKAESKKPCFLAMRSGGDISAFCFVLSAFPQGRHTALATFVQAQQARAAFKAVLDRLGTYAAGVRAYRLRIARERLRNWVLWEAPDGGYAARHASNYMLHAATLADFDQQARRMNHLLAVFVDHGWTVAPKPDAEGGWYAANNLSAGRIDAATIEALAFAVWRTYDTGRTPNLPLELWQRVWVDGWRFEYETVGLYRFVRNGIAWEPSFAELCHTYDYEPGREQAA